MRLPQLAIANYQFVIVLVLLAIATGVMSFINMPRSEDPVLEFPGYNILVVYPGTSPSDLEELVVDPIEEKLNEIDDIDELKTTIQDGFAFISIEADFSVDIDDKFDEIQAALNAVESELPDEIVELKLTQFSPLNVSIMQLAMSSENANYHELIDYGDRLKDELEKVSGVRNVEMVAYPEEEIRISVDFEKLARFEIPLNQLLGILQGNNANIPGGDINAGTQNFTIKTSGGYKSIEELKNTVIKAQGNQWIYVKDVADVFLGYEDQNWEGKFNGKPALFVYLTQKEGENILQLNERLTTTVEGFKKDLPDDISLYLAFEQAPAVDERINDFFLNLLQGVLLVGIIIFLFLGIRNALIIMTVIPTSILVAIFALDSTGIGLQQISIAGLVIALGLLVDNGIVVVENINRYLKEGASLLDAAVKGTGEVGWAIVSSTATTILAFFPMSQLGGGTGEFLKSMPLIVIYCLLASLVLALSFTPLLSRRLLNANWAKRQSRTDKVMGNLIKKVYRPALNFSLKRPIIVLILAFLSLGGSFALFPYVGISFFPNADKPLLLIDIDTPQGTSLDRTREAAEFVERVLDTTDFVTSYATNIGHGNPQVYYNTFPENFKKHHAQVLVNLKEWDPDRFYPLIDELRYTFSGYTGARMSVVELKNGPPYAAPIEIRVIGDHLDTLSYLAQKVYDLVDQTPGTINTFNPLEISKTDLKIDIHRDKAGLLGVQISDIDLAVRTAIAGTEIGTMNTPAGDKYDMVVDMLVDDEPQISDFEKISVANVQGAQVPLKQISSLQFASAPSKIDHFDLQRNVAITADVLSDYNSTNVTLEIIDKLNAFDLPDGYSYFVGGEYETQQESFGDLGTLLLVAIMGIFAVLILQFRSFVQPFVVLSAIPLAFTGSIVALFLAGYSFSFFAFVGFTSLVGIVVNTSIILVDYTNQLMAKGKPLKEALLQACETRFTPIILTTLTTICGLLPLTLTNSGLWSPLGWTIIGGMISSTLLTLLIVPILYSWLTKKRVA